MSLKSNYKLDSCLFYVFYVLFVGFHTTLSLNALFAWDQCLGYGIWWNSPTFSYKFLDILYFFNFSLIYFMFSTLNFNHWLQLLKFELYGWMKFTHFLLQIFIYFIFYILNFSLIYFIFSTFNQIRLARQNGWLTRLSCTWLMGLGLVVYLAWLDLA